MSNAIFDADRDDSEFGYQFLADEIRQNLDHAAGVESACSGDRPERIMICSSALVIGQTPRQ